MIKNKKTNVKKIVKKCSIIAALFSLSALPFIAIATSNNQLSQHNNVINTYNDTNVAKPKNIEYRNWDSQSSDFLLNANNAITLNQNVNYKSSTSIVNGPEGFLANYNNQLSYVGYNGALKWNVPSIEFNNSDKFLISSYYNSYSNSFVILYSTSNTTIIVATISADNGQVLATSTAITTTNVARYLLVPVNNSAENNEVNTYAVISKSSVSANSRILTSIIINRQGLIDSQTTINFVDTPGSEQTNYMILSSGAIVINNVSYYFFLSSFQDGRVWLRVFAQNNNKLNFLSHTRVLNDWNTNYVDTVLDNNIPEIWVSTKNNQIEIAAFLNAIPSKPWLFGATVSLSPSAANLKINSIDLSDVNIVSFNIQNARFYGDYLYGYLTQGTQNYIIRLKVSDQNANTWNPAGLTWDPNDVDYTNNDRIILYDISYANTNANIIAQPIYQAASNYSGNNQLFVMDTKATNLWLLDGNKPAFAYDTWAKKDIANIAISGVSDIFVADANSDLKAYFTNASLSEYFSQYQTSTTYTIEKKTSTDVTIEHAKGNLPATLVIEKGYDSNGFAPVTRSFDIVLTGFKNFKTSLDSNPSLDIALNNTLAQSIESNAPINTTLRTYLLENIILPKNTLSEADIASIEVESYNNITGTLVLRSITLNRYYGDGGILVTTPFTFRQEITINGFKKINPTAIVANNSFTFSELNATLATEISESQLQQLIFAKRNEIFVNLPDDFATNNIIAPWNITNINDTAGSLDASFNLDNYYDTDGLGTLKTSPKIFGPITITGFNQLTYKTSINLNPTKTTDLENILAQTVDLSNETFKQYLLEHVIVDPSQNIRIQNITSIQIKDNSFNNIDGTLVLESITLNKWYDDKSILQNSEEVFPGEINLQGFKKVEPTAIVANNSFTFSELNAILASKISDIQLQQLIFAKRNEIFITNSLPDDFAENNIIAPFLKTDINDTTGSLNVSFNLNNYYDTDTKGTLKTSPKIFGPITITGFNQLNQETSINFNPTETKDLENILAQTVDLSNETFKQYLLEHVIVDSSQNITIDNIISIQIKPDSFNNLTGTLVLDSITLNKWYDDKSILQNSDKVFVGEINLQGFKKVEPTKLRDPATPDGILTIDGGKKGVLASDVTDEEIWEIILAKKNEIFVDKSLPDDLKSSIEENLYPWKLDVDDKAGTIKIYFDLTSFYAEDNKATLITYVPNDPSTKKEFGPLLIKGFVDVSTYLKRADMDVLINLDEYPYEQRGFAVQPDTGGSLDAIKQFIFDNMLENKTGLVYTDISQMWLDSYDNKQGILKLDKIQMTKSVLPSGAVTCITRTLFLWEEDKQGVEQKVPIEIPGFKKVIGFTQANPNAVAVNDGLETIKISDLINDQNRELFLAWIQNNKNTLIFNLPDKPYSTGIEVTGFDQNNTNQELGILAITLQVSAYYDNDNLYTYRATSKEFTVILNGFKNDLATGVITSPIPIEMKDVLAQTFTKNSGLVPEPAQEEKFKKYLLDSVIAGKKDGVIIEGYTGDYDNLNGIFILTSITLNQSYDESGSVNPGPYSPIIPSEGITINGFKKVLATKLNANVVIDGGLNTILASGVSDEQIKNIIFINKDTIFVGNSLPDDFSVDNIITITIDKLEIDDKAGTLKISFELNNYYDNDNKGTLTTSTNKSFGDIIISGFKQVMLETTINKNPTKTTDLENILAQTVDLNETFKRYLLEHVIVDPSQNIGIENITSIQIKDNSFNNIDGTLVLESITLNKWYDDKSILQTREREFLGEINLQGFKKVNPTDLKITEINWGALEWWNDIKNDQDPNNYKIKLREFIFAKRNDIFVNLPENFDKSNIIEITEPKFVNDRTEEEIKFVFTISNYYDNDDRVTWIEHGSTSFTLTINGFNQSKATFVDLSFDLGENEKLAQTYYDNTDSDTIRTTIFNNLIKNTNDNAGIVQISSNDVKLSGIAFNNKDGVVTINEISLTKYINYKGELIEGIKHFSGGPFIISGFKKIDKPTGIRDENIKIEGSLANSEVNTINYETLKKWIFDNKNGIFDSLPEGASISISDNFIPNNNDGMIKVTVTINKYYDNTEKHELIEGPKEFTFNVIGFVRTNPFPIIPVALGAGAAVVITIIAVATIIYFYRRKKYKTTNVTSEKDL